MKGFKNSTRTRAGFSFPSSAGFTASTGKVQNIAYTRKTPHRKPLMKAEGGVVDSALQGRNEPSSALDQESGGKTPLRPGFKSGGKPLKKATGGAIGMMKNRMMPHPGAGMAAPARMALGSPGRVQLPQQVMGRAVMRSTGGTVPKYAKGGQIPAHKVAARAEKGINQHTAVQSGGKLLK